jgi:hypothetical protein
MHEVEQFPIFFYMSCQVAAVNCAGSGPAFAASNLNAMIGTCRHRLGITYLSIGLGKNLRHLFLLLDDCGVSTSHDYCSFSDYFSLVFLRREPSNCYCISSGLKSSYRSTHSSAIASASQSGPSSRYRRQRPASPALTSTPPQVASQRYHRPHSKLHGPEEEHSYSDTLGAGH